jgi:hypothetical protein
MGLLLRDGAAPSGASPVRRGEGSNVPQGTADSKDMHRVEHLLCFGGAREDFKAIDAVATRIVFHSQVG